MALSLPKTNITYLNENKGKILIFVSFMMLLALTISKHEMWRDEFEAYLLVKDAKSFQDVAENTKFGGHPPIWFYLLFFTKLVYNSPVSMQVLHFSIAVGAGFLLYRYAPFTPALKIMNLFGYYLLYEYGVIARNYSISILLIFLALSRLRTSLPSQKSKDFVIILVCLFCLPLTNACAIALAFGFTCWVLLEPTNTWNIRMKGIVGVVALLAVGVSAWLTWPAEGAYFVPMTTSFQTDRFFQIMQTIPRSLVPIGPFSIEFWETSLIDRLPVVFGLLLSLMLVGLSLFSFRESISVVAGFLASVLFLLIFFYVVHYGGSRHHGFFYLIFIMFSWIYHLRKKDSPTSPTPRFPLILYAVSFFALIGGINAILQDIRHPFSNAKQIASDIRRLPNQPVWLAGAVDYAMTPVSGYLNQPVYSPKVNRYITYTAWTKERANELTESDMLDRVERERPKNREKAYLLLNQPIDPKLLASRGYKLLLIRTGACVSTENYGIYEIPGK